MSMQAILAASQSMVRMQTLQSAKTQMQGTANVLRAESKQDGGDEQKDAQAAALDEKSNGLMNDLMKEATDVNETLKPDEDVKAEEDAKEEAEEGVKQPKADTLELSDSATGLIGGLSYAKAVVGEAVTYKADGSTAPNVLAKSDPLFKTTA